MANELKMVFGSSTTVISHAAALASGANTYTGLTGLTNTQLDNSTLLYPYARAVLGVPDGQQSSRLSLASAPVPRWHWPPGQERKEVHRFRVLTGWCLATTASPSATQRKG